MSVDNLKIEIKKFEELQRRFARYGAADTEPDAVFQVLMVRAFKGDKPQVPMDGSGWQLFSSSMDCRRAAIGLARQAKVVLDVIERCPIGQSQKVQEYLRDYCWRVSW